MKKKFFPPILCLSLFLLAACSRSPGSAPESSAVPLATPSAQASLTPSPAPAGAPIEPTPTLESSPGASAALAQPTPTPETALSPTPEASPIADPTTQAQATPSQPECTDLAAFYGDVTIPDGTFFRAGERFTKTWRFRNHSPWRHPTMNDPATFLQAMRYIGAGLAIIGVAGAGAGIGIVVGGAVQAMSRNPDFTGTIQTNMILGIAFAEAVAIYALAVALIILFV